MSNYKIVMFGTGSSSDKIEKFLNFEKCHIVAYVDNNEEKHGQLHKYINVYSPNALLTIDFDYIIIGSMYFEEIYEQLRHLQVEQQKIINVYEWIRYEDVNEMMKKVDQEHPEILITGMSYGRYGFDLKTLKKPAINLSFNSQDLFYDYCVAKWAAEKFSTLKIAIISLCYYDFQFDLSQSKEKHLVNRYECIKEVQKVVDVEKYEQQVVPNLKNRMIKNNVEHLFVQNFIEDFDKLSQKDRITRDLRIERAFLAKTHSNKNYPQTVQYNIVIFEQYLKMLIQHHITPIIIIHPQARDYRLHFSQDMIKEFEQIIQQFAGIYDVDVLNLYSDERFTDEDFYDVHHLNDVGAKKVSHMTNDFLGDKDD